MMKAPASICHEVDMRFGTHANTKEFKAGDTMRRRIVYLGLYSLVQITSGYHMPFVTVYVYLLFVSVSTRAVAVVNLTCTSKMGSRYGISHNWKQAVSGLPRLPRQINTPSNWKSQTRMPRISLAFVPIRPGNL